MMKRLLLAVICLVVLTGCWDTRHFKNVKLVLTIGFDAADDEKIKSTVSIPTIRRGADGPGEETVSVLSEIGYTPRSAREKIDLRISNAFDPSKLEVLLLGEELAKKDIYPVLDVFYRNPKNNLNAKLAVIEGEVEEAIGMQPNIDTRPSKYISGLLDAVKDATHTTGDNLQLICAELFEPGVDFVLPLLKVDKEMSTLKFNGLALFHDKVYTGDKITPEQTTLLMLMMGYKGKVARFTTQVLEDEEEQIMNYISFNVMNLDRNLNINVKDGEVEAVINLKLNIRVVEYPKKHLDKATEVTKLDDKLSEELTKEAKDIISRLQEANSDVFSIGRRIQAYHYKEWKKMDWNEEFSQITITPKVEVNIQQQGVIN
ncbi:Ger(x)C family spore germination protein [Thalassobacillus sp. CUG 92003]|uniref:Ger(x)C family spore germination protein n=1 Tax=Thalassobacillus sp. CUG 92003 TaxID=2736641 RepID=UPI002105797C|nr:Ger(x)C family spore germination protein [Thalassobacillus sp. CUG 92003]